MNKIHRLALAATVLAACLYAGGCSGGADVEDAPLKTSAAVDNNSEAAKTAGPAPLINPDVPPPGVRKGAGN